MKMITKMIAVSVIGLILLGIYLLLILNRDHSGAMFASGLVTAIESKLIKDIEIPTSTLSLLLSGNSRCRLIESDASKVSKLTIPIGLRQSCTAKFARNEEKKIRRLPRITHYNGGCLIMLKHYNKKELKEPEKHELSGTLGDAGLTLTLFEGGGKLDVYAHSGTGCTLFFEPQGS